MITLTKEFEKALEVFEDKSKQLVFLTGNAGTGKSTLIKHFLKNTKQKCVVLAPTAIAASNVGGSTIHSFFKLKHSPNLCDESNSLHKLDFKTLSLFDTIIIDEISMVRSDVFWAICLILEMSNNSLLAGKKIIVVGDMCQLPPVTTDDTQRTRIKQYLGGLYWFFGCPQNTEVHKVELTTIFRQNDNSFISILNELRKPNGDFKTVLNALNERLTTNIPSKKVVLAPTNAIADTINTHKLNELKGKPRTFEAEIEGNCKESDFAVNQFITLKEGARVVFCTNTDMYKNGELGTIISLSQNHIEVLKDNEDLVFVEPFKFSKNAYKTEISLDNNKLTSKLVIGEIGSFTQIPLKLAYALTIHKSQGQTFEGVHIQNDRPMFAHGQLYVALSRCTSLNGLSISQPLTKRDIVFDKEALI